MSLYSLDSIVFEAALKRWWDPIHMYKAEILFMRWTRFSNLLVFMDIVHNKLGDSKVTEMLSNP